MRLPSAFPFAFGQRQAEAGLAVRSGPGEPPAVLGRHLLGERQAEPDAFGLARDERLEQGRRPAPAAAPARCR